MKKVMILGLLPVMLAMIKPTVFSHCEVPCGIYNDEMRFTMIEEHITTIEKAMTEIAALSKEDPRNMNQIVRWIMNKEQHADDIQHIISQYFLTQRLKLVDKEDSKAANELIQKLTFCHEILVFAMKTKQTTDLASVESLKAAVSNFKSVYFKNHKH
ncbi:MAG: superoxide dismutase [Candidatus Aminicenantes bacterium]|nr:superoxide dismutase [Candidatus Aminicenantes bacterium]